MLIFILSHKIILVINWQKMSLRPIIQYLFCNSYGESWTYFDNPYIYLKRNKKYMTNSDKLFVGTM